MLALVAGSLGPSILNFVVDFNSGKPLDTEIFERAGRLTADKGIDRLMLAVEKESGASEVVYSVVTENKMLLFLEGSESRFLFFWQNMILFA